VTRDGAGCPVCGNPVLWTWEFGPGERLGDEEEYPEGRGYVHVEATPDTRDEYARRGREAFDGAACFEFADGTTEINDYPPQPIDESGGVRADENLIQ